MLVFGLWMCSNCSILFLVMWLVVLVRICMIGMWFNLIISWKLCEYRKLFISMFGVLFYRVLVVL